MFKICCCTNRRQQQKSSALFVSSDNPDSLGRSSVPMGFVPRSGLVGDDTAQMPREPSRKQDKRQQTAEQNQNTAELEPLRLLGRSSKRNSKASSERSISQDSLKRQKELKQASYNRLRQDFGLSKPERLERITSYSGYDSDANAIPTPAATQRRSEQETDKLLEDIEDEGPGRSDRDRRGTNSSLARRNAVRLAPLRAGLRNHPLLQRSSGRSSIGNSVKGIYASSVPLPGRTHSRELKVPSDNSVRSTHRDSFGLPIDVLKSPSLGRSITRANTGVRRLTPFPPGPTAISSRELEALSTAQPKLDHNTLDFGGVDGQARQINGKDRKENLSASTEDTVAKNAAASLANSNQRHSSESDSDNFSPVTKLIASIVIPPKSPSRCISNTSHQSANASKHHSRRYSTSVHSGDSAYQYSGSFAPAELPVFRIAKISTTPKPKSSIKVSKRRQEKKARASKFVEEFELSKKPSLERSLDGNEDMPFMSGGRLRPSGHTFLAPRSEGFGAWETALNAYREQTTPNGDRSRSPMNGRLWGDRRRSKLRLSHSPISLPTYPASVRVSRGRSIDTGDIPPDFLISKPDVPIRDLRPRPSGMWAKWPSHTREERIGSAGAGDHVSSYDFVNDHPVQSSKPLDLDKLKLKRSSSVASRNVFQILRDRYIYEGSDGLRMERGYRSSVSTGGETKYPDLELLPKLEPATFVIPPSPIISGKRDAGSGSSAYGSTSPDYSGVGYGSDLDLTELPQHSARTWSKIYRQVIQLPTSDEEAEDEEVNGKLLGVKRPDLLSPNYIPRVFNKDKGKASLLVSKSEPSLIPERPESRLSGKTSMIDLKPMIRVMEPETEALLAGLAVPPEVR